MIKHKPLQRDELPHQGTLVSIDAEFVSLQQEEVEYRSDGTKSLIRPSRMALARVSVLRGEGPSTGIPFIDDHIQVNEPIIDYLTEFSGIRRKHQSSSVSPLWYVLTCVVHSSRRFGCEDFSAHASTLKGGIQEAEIACRSWVHVHRSRLEQGLPYH